MPIDAQDPDKRPPVLPTEEFSWRRAGEFLKNILSLERSYRSLKSDNEQLRRQVDELQRLVDDHNGQLKAILSTLNSTIANRIEASAEKAAVETVLRLLDKGRQD